MSIFNRKKKVSDTERPDDDVIQEAYDNIDKLNDKKLPIWVRDRHGHHQLSYKNEIFNNKLDTKIKHEQKRIELAEERKSNPKPVPQQVTYNNSKTTTINTQISAFNGHKKGVVVDSFDGNGNNNGNNYAKKSSAKSAKNSRRQASPEPAEPTKNSNAKTILFLVVFGIVLVGVAALSIYLSTCKTNSAQSTAAAIFASTSE